MSLETDKDQWRIDAENIMHTMHERISLLEKAVISQQKIMEALATDVLKPKLIRPQLSA